MTRTMKDSGVEWIGQIPEDWEFHKLKYHIHIKSGDMLTKSDLTDDGIFPVYGGGEMIGYANKSNTKCNQILIGRVGARCGCVTLPEKDCWATDNALVITSLLPIKLLYYSLVAADLNNINISNAQPLITGNKVKNIIIPFPPLPEQQAIADYLDDKCAQIDNITATINEQIEVLKQYKKSVITEAVTKGLDSDEPMKDSGVEWIGQIPEKWELTRIAGLYNLRNTKVSDKDFPALSVTNKGILPQLETAAKTNAGDNRKLVCIGDFAINSRSDRRGSCGISPYNGSVSLINLVLTPRNKTIPKYFDWLFHTVQFGDEFYRWGHGIVDDLWSTGWDEMKKILVPIPPLPEQQAIADYLDNKCAQIDAVIADKQAQLETLAAYKKSLIYEYVTGKKSVPGFEEA